MHESQSQSQPQSFWLPYDHPTVPPIDIKTEPFSESPYSLISPPTSPQTTPVTPHSTLPLSIPRRRSTNSITGSKRVRPYPSVPRENRFRSEDSGKMATIPAFESWSPSGTKGGKSNQPAERRSPDGELALSLNHAFAPHFVGRSSDRPEHRPASSNSNLTSSLTGAMGDAHVSSHSRHSGSPPDRGDQPYNVGMSQGMVWSPQSQGQTMSMVSHHAPYAGVSGQGNTMTYNDATNPMYHDYNSTYRNNPSPESLSPPSPSFPSTSYAHLAFQPQRGHQAMQPRPGSSSHYNAGATPVARSSSSHYRTSSSVTTQDKLDSEVRHLRKRMQELDLANEQARNRVKELEVQLAGGMHDGQRGGGSSSIGGLPPPSSSFQASWKARTDARIRQFCSLNRAGNALCAWHDSRRERRAYPPRMAPAGYLNCGCSYEEALFEESLSRHSVGSYLPGESVRMDPALRNPLLKLLQSRYGYKDGDFERDPRSGGWVHGEGHAYWEQKVQAGLSSRKSRSEGASSSRPN